MQMGGTKETFCTAEDPAHAFFKTAVRPKGKLCPLFLFVKQGGERVPPA